MHIHFRNGQHGVLTRKGVSIFFFRDERVMGIVPEGTARSHVIAQPECMWPVPSHWSLEDAATVPLAYAYAYYCLHIKVRTNIHFFSNNFRMESLTL